MDKLLVLLEGLGIPFAYDHFAEGEGPDPPFLCYLLSGSDDFAADGRFTTGSARCGWNCIPTIRILL